MTLIELLVTIGLLLVIAGLLIVPMFTGFGLLGSGAARGDAQTAARQITAVLTREMADAMDIYLDPANPELIAFIRARNPAGNVTYPLAPEATAVRYWRVKRSNLDGRPGDAYLPFDQAFLSKDEPNPYLLARTTIADPFGTVPADSNRFRAVSTYVPYPENVDITNPVGLREYRDQVVPLGPSGRDYDVTRLSFTPTASASENLARSADLAVYRGRYPLWVTDGAFWNDPANPTFSVFRSGTLLYRAAMTLNDPRVWVLTTGGVPVYCTADWPNRASQGSDPPYGFGIDYSRGELRFDFLPPGDTTMPNWGVAQGDPEVLRGDWLPPIWTSHQYQLRAGAPPASNPGGPPRYSNVVIIPGSDSVRVTGVWDAAVGPETRTYLRVNGTPDLNRDEYSLDRYAVGGDASRAGKITFGRLPNSWVGPGGGDQLSVSYRWRNNYYYAGLPDPILENPENPDNNDLVIANYRSKAVINLTLTLVKQDPRSGSGHSVTLHDRITLRNPPR